MGCVSFFLFILVILVRCQIRILLHVEYFSIPIALNFKLLRQNLILQGPTFKICQVVLEHLLGQGKLFPNIEARPFFIFYPISHELWDFPVSFSGILYYSRPWENMDTVHSTPYWWLFFPGLKQFVLIRTLLNTQGRPTTDLRSALSALLLWYSALRTLLHYFSIDSQLHLFNSISSTAWLHLSSASSTMAWKCS